MADYDENEDDLFADLYDGDDSAPAAAPAPASVPLIANTPQFDPLPSIAQPSAPSDPIVNGSNGVAYDHPTAHASAVNDDDNAQQQDYKQAYDGNDMQDVQSWQGNQQAHGGMKHDQDHGDDYDRPIGIKEDGKMFIGGLNWETTDQSLKEYFSQFGEVAECTVMRDGASGRSRGFGFLTFRDPKCVNTVMVKEHQLDGKIIDPKRAIPRDEQERTSKIFVGGVSQEATEQDFKQFFMQFGRVLDATLMMDKDTGRPRGFGFVTFDSEAAVDRTLQGPLEILNKPIEVKKAQPRGNMRDDNNNNNSNNDRGNNRFRQGGNDKFGRNDQQGFNAQQSQAADAQGGNNMSQAMMAQYWSRMQQYFQMMRQQMAANMGQGGGMNNPMAAMGGQPNPQMMQQMMAMQNGMGGGQGMPSGMNPAMMQQMAQMQQQGGFQGGMPQGMPQQSMPQQGMQQQGMQQGMQQQQGMQPQSGMQGSMSPMNGGPGSRPGYTAQEQLAFEQQKYEQQQQRGGGGGGGANAPGFSGTGSPTSWEGMYDDVPAPAGPQGGGGGGGMRGGGNFRGRGGRGSQGPVGPAAQAPANAPTGPKNAGRPGANYRGGGRGGHRGGFHPYARG